MRIKLKYGTYEHALSEASVVITKEAQLSDSGQPFVYNTRWDIEGKLIAATQADLTTAITALETAYKTQGLDLSLLFEDNSPTAHALTSSNTYGGPRVRMAPSYPIGENGDYTLYRSYKITVEADEKVYATNETLRYEEVVEVRGTGGQRRAVIEVLSGTPQEQITTTASVVSATQRGTIVGLSGYLSYPTPLWPTAEQLNERTILRKSPRSIGVAGSRVQREYELSWSYSFLSAVPLAGGIPSFLA